MPKWRNLAKSGHTAPLHLVALYINLLCIPPFRSSQVVVVVVCSSSCYSRQKRRAINTIDKNNSELCSTSKATFFESQTPFPFHVNLSSIFISCTISLYLYFIKNMGHTRPFLFIFVLYLIQLPNKV